MAWWTKQELLDAGLVLDDVLLLTAAAPKRRMWKERIYDKRGKPVGFTPAQIQVWIPKEQPLSAAVFVAAARSGA